MPLYPHPFTECSPLQDVYYRRREVYSLAWSHSTQDLGDYILASANNGGYLALTRDPRKLVALGKAAILKPKILVYTAAGQLVESIPWDPANRIVGLGFTSQEQLVVVLDEGVARIYTLLTPCPATPASAHHLDSEFSNAASAPISATPTCYYVQHSLGSEATETGIVEARVWDQGLVALTGGGRFVDFRFPSQNTDEEAEGIWDEYSQPPVPELLPPVPVSSSTAAGPPIPTAWAFIPPTVSSSGLLEVLLSPPPSFSASSTSAPSGPSVTSSGSGSGTSTPTPPSPGTVFSLDSVSGATDMRLNRGPFSAIVASPNGKLLALLTADKKLWVVSSDFQRSLSEFDVTACEAYIQCPDRTSFSADAPSIGQTGIRQIQWCSNNTVALAWEHEVVMVGPFGDSLRYFYENPMHLLSEIDGVRVISADKHEFIQKVADSTSAVFRPGSTDVAAMLYDASDNFAQRSAKADEGIRAIRSELAAAVDTCIDAASQEWEVYWQRRLLKAASFGKAFLDSSYDSSSFVDMSRKLRVLNNVRAYEVGVPLSFEQFESFGAAALLSRLTNRNHHLLSLRIASHLRQRPDPILKHWARAKIARSATSLSIPSTADDDELCDTIVRKFESLDGFVTVSYSSIASSAFRSGRTHLATKLLNHEPRAVDQVPLLLKMGEDSLALQKSVESGDTDLVYHVLLRLKTQLSRGDFFRVVQAPLAAVAAAAAPGDQQQQQAQKHAQMQASAGPQSKLALRLLEAYARTYDRELLKDLYFTDDRRVEAAMLALQEAQMENAKQQDASTSTSTSTFAEEQLAAMVFKRKEASKLFSEDRERGLEAKLVDESVRLLSFQQALEKDDGHRSTWVGLSLNDTIRECLVKGKHAGAMAKRAEKLRVDFKIPEKRWWCVKVDAYIKTRDWEGLWTFANSRKPPPIGFEPVITKLLAVHAEGEALRYVPRVVLAGDKADRAKFSALLARLPPHVAAPLRDRAETRS